VMSNPRAYRFGVPLEHTWTCERAGPRPCGRCDPCKARANAFIEAVMAVLSEALPDRAVSPYSRLVSPLIVGKDQETDHQYVYTSFCAAAGAGAVTGYDGYQCACDMGTLGVVGKTDAEIIEALKANIAYFNIESESELKNLIQLAKEHGKQPRVALRVNPDIEYKTHGYLTTGKKETKFGVDIERAQKDFADFGKNGIVNLCAIHVHLGTGGKKIDPYIEAVKKVLPLIEKLRRQGYIIEALDLGGGYGADYESDTVPSAAEYVSRT
jgi:hypothetical protein